MEFFAGQGLVTAASDGEGRGRRFPEPPQHGDSSMLVIRDALLSQLQKDRLHQEIIMAELAEIERAMALRSADAGRANPASLHSNEPFMPRGGGAAAGAEPGVGADEENPPSSIRWSCSICQAKATSEGNLQQHFAGQKHQSKVAALVEAQKYLSEWGCGICQAKCKPVTEFEDHCRGRGHQQKIEALLKGGTNTRSSVFQVLKKPPSDGSNSKGRSSELCDLHCNSKNTLAEHRRGKKHTEKVEKRMSLSYCKVCNLHCNSEKMLAHHCTGKAHLAKVNGC
ncbi:hypothetical protein SETIT_2G208100v2 [Setaria italica]|uniref:C2H2-type domain-containing protein n=1 Tax=Setaria italica TaxID=4555 RepID=A0A368Q209_SETIT|nr:hypothetical protein SETIT_2G208100v2 [Setaria italica]